MVYTFKESWLRQPQGGKRLPLLFAAADRLNQSIQNGDVPLVSLRGDPRPFRSEVQGILKYAVTDCGNVNSWNSIKLAHFDASHFIGTYSTTIGGEVVTVRIEPRWGNAILSYLLQFTTGIYQPPDAIAATGQQKDGAAWILALLWKSHFSQALRTYHLPKEYCERRTNGRYFRGRLDVPRHIRENSVDQSRFACVDAPLTLDTILGRTIRYAIRLLASPKAFPGLMCDLSGFDERLAACGVKATEVRPAEIDAIRYTRLSEGYRSLMQVSKAIIRRFGGGAGNAIGHVPSYFIDMAELWENYLLAILRRHLPGEYQVFSPNEAGGDWLLEGDKRQIRPDLLIKKDGVVVAVLDAKFKNYTQVGTYENGGVSREDLYQMGTYLYHYSRSDHPILGLFVTPVPGKTTANIETIARHPHHKLGVAAFDITGWENDTTGQGVSIDLIREAENAFAKKVSEALKARH